MRHLWLSLGTVVSLLLAACATPQRVPAPPAPPAIVALPAVRPLAPPPPGVKTLGQATLGAVGDVLMHGAVKNSAAARVEGDAAGGYAWLYAALKDELSAPDVMFANLETPIAPDAGKGTRQFVFNAPLDAVRALQVSGVDLVSVANNHAFDQGRPGFLETMRRLDELGMPCPTWAVAPCRTRPACGCST